MSARKTYVAVFEHDAREGVWLVRVKGVEGCHTYGRTLRQAEDRVREALAAWLDRDAGSLTITAELPPDVTLLARDVSEARHAAERAGADAQRATVDAVKRLTEMGLSRRDAAEVLGISHQRVQQLLAS
jgi:predicted RNase H-like HicB family nuclease